MADSIPVIKFHKRKYGDELLVDVVTLDTIRNSKTFARVMRQSFYGLMLTTGGEGDVEGNTVTETDRVARFRQLVDEHFLSEIGVEFYADKLCVTSNYLNRLVRQSLGKSTKQYIQNRRVEEAKRLLRYTWLPIADIAEKLNFDTSSYFVRAFAKAEGNTRTASTTSPNNIPSRRQSSIT